MTLARFPPAPLPEDALPAAWFESATKAFQAARATNSTTVQTYRIGPCAVRIHLVGPRLTQRLSPALQHLVVSDPLPPTLDVLVWDDASSQSRMPAPPWDWNTARLPRGEINGYNTARFATTFNADSGALNMLDRQRRTAIFWLRDLHNLPTYEWSAPLRQILHWALTMDGLHVVHGGAVGTPQGAVMLTGKGGSGKSTSVLACLDSSLRYLADDYCAFSLDPEPFVWSLYSSAKLSADSLARLPALRPDVVNPADLPNEKGVLFLNDRWASKLLNCAPLRAILLPRIRGGGATTLSPATPAESVKALAPTTVMQMVRAHISTVHAINQLTLQLPSYWLELGTDVTQIPEVITALLRRLNA